MQVTIQLESYRTINNPIDDDMHGIIDVFGSGFRVPFSVYYDHTTFDKCCSKFL